MDPLPLVVCGTAAALYALGRRGRTRLWREIGFYSGVALAFVVLERPFDDWADSWLSVHMAQHIVLMTVVPPLVVLGRPWPRMWLPFPLRARRAVGRALSGSSPFRRGAGFLKRPWIALAVQSAMVAVWHVPQLYDAAARNEWIHVLEHVCFVAPALVFWGALLDAPPVRARIDDLHRAIWFAAAMVPSWILAIVLAFASVPIYSAYPSLTDQQLAAGVMWVPGSLAYFVAAFAAFYRWLAPGVTQAPVALPPSPDPRSSHGPDRLVPRRRRPQLGAAARPARRRHDLVAARPTPPLRRRRVATSPGDLRPTACRRA